MKGLFFVLIACFAWAFDTLIRYPLLNQIKPSLIVFIEHLFLTLIFLPFFYKNYKKLSSVTIGDFFYFLILGGLGSALSTLAFTKAFTYINPSIVIILQKFQPLIAVVLARILLKESLNKIFIFWALVCVLGVLLIGHQDITNVYSLALSSKINFNSQTMIGYGLTFIAVFGWAASTVIGKILDRRGYKVKELMGGRFLIGFLFLTPIFISNGLSLPTVPVIWSKILLMVLISGLFGMYFYYKGLRLLSARVCTLAELFFPLCAIGVNWLFLGITLDIYQIIGASILIVSSTLIQLNRY